LHQAIIGINGRLLNSAIARSSGITCIAMTDAPTSALSDIYTSEGIFKRYLILTHNPTVILVDACILRGCQTTDSESELIGCR
jgi:hypothetical protein